MNSQHKGPIIYIIILALFILSFGLGRYMAKPETILEEHERIDTLIIRDTVTHYVPQYVHRHTRDTIRVPIRETIHDTVAVYLPRETKVYEDARYRAEVSGYQPSLDRIDIFVKDRIVTQDKTQIVTVKRNARWGIGLQVGYGAILNDRRIQGTPYIGVGLSWNILTF